jgi:hypothetical protein
MVYCDAGIAAGKTTLVSQEGYHVAHLSFTALQHPETLGTSASDCQPTVSSDNLMRPPLNSVANN